MRFPFINYLKKKRMTFKMIMKVRSNIRKIHSDKDLTHTQIREVKRYFKDRLGINVNTYWHRYYYKRTGVYSPEFIPTSLYRLELLGRMNQMEYECAYRDKNLAETIITGIQHPVTVVKNMNGYYFMNGVAVDMETAVGACSDLDDVIIKPSLLSYGMGVKKFSVRNGITSDGVTLEQLFNSYKSDFIVQKAVHQHEAMNALNPSSVNTLRIFTYRSGMEILVLYTVLRIGRLGKVTDNETSGGMSVRINKDGTLAKYAYSRPGDDMIEKTDTGIVLDGYMIPFYDKAVETVKATHLQLPYYNLIGWDISIDMEGNPVLIEWNTQPDLSQSANEGPAFGEYTDRILREVWNRPNTLYR